MNWARILYRTGAWVLILCAAAHTIGHVSSQGAAPQNESERQLLHWMESYVLPGIGRSMQELFDGFSWSFSLMSLAIGALCLVAGRSGDAASERRMAAVAALAMALESIIGLKYWFVAPNSFLIVSAVAFTGAAILGKK